MPRIEVAAEHHDFVLLVRSRDLGDGVVRRLPFRIDTVDDVEFELDGGAVSENARDAAVILVPHDDGRHGGGDVVGAVVERDDLPVFASGVVDADLRAVRQEEAIDLFADLRGRHRGRRSGGSAAAAAERAGVRVVGVELPAHLLVVAAPGRRRDRHRHEQVPADENDVAAHLVLLRVEKRGELVARRTVRQNHVIRRRLHRPLGTGRPREHLAGQLVLHRRENVRRKPFVHPARMPELPRLEMAVREAPRFHRLDRPLARGLEAGCAGEPRPVHIGEEVKRPHDLGVCVLFLADSGVDIAVARLRQHRREQGSRQHDRQQAFRHDVS